MSSAGRIDSANGPPLSVGPPAAADLIFDDWVLRRGAGELWRSGVRVHLQEQPLQILDELLARPHELVTREQLIRRLWPKGVVDFDTSLNTAMRKLRVVLEDDAERPRYIETVPRKGYRFVGHVEPAPVATAPLSAPAWVDARPPGAAAERRAEPGRRRWAVAAVGLLALAAALFFFVDEGRDPRASSGAGSGPVARLAILPFRTLAADSDDEVFAAGLHEEIIATLAERAPQLEVISRTTMANHRYRNATVQQIAEELGATHVIDGSVRRDDEQVRLALQLVDARTDRQLWSRSFDRGLQAAISLQSDVAGDVAAQLSARLAGPDPPPITTNLEAFDLYLQAKARQPDIGPAEPAAPRQRILDLVNRAIDLDPEFAHAYLVRSRVHLDYFLSNLDVSEDRLGRARADLATARRLAGDELFGQDVSAWLAAFVDLDPEEGLRLAAMVPQDPLTQQNAARILSSLGRLEESDRIFERLLTLDPANQRLLRMRGGNLAADGRVREYLRHTRWLQQISPPERDPCVCMFLYTGVIDFARPSTAALIESVSSREPDNGPLLELVGELGMLRAEHRYAETRQLLDRVGVESVRVGGLTGTVPGLGHQPIAALKAWNDLLLNDHEAAAGNGRAVLDFVAAEQPTKWNAWFLRSLEAQAHLFMGERGTAVAIAREALRMPLADVHMQRYREWLALLTLAWAGEQDEAVAVLERMATSAPRLAPMILARDPLLTVSLEHNARYRALQEAADAEISANSLL